MPKKGHCRWKVLMGALLAVLATACSSSTSLPAVTPESSIVDASPVGGSQIQPSSAGGEDVVATASNIGLVGGKDAGAADPTAPLSLTITLKYRNQAKLDRLVLQQTDKNSAEYHHWLTSSQFNAEFALPSAEYSQVIKALKTGGFRVTHEFNNRTVVNVVGSVNTVERFFRVTVRKVRLASKGVGYANITPAYAPKNVADAVFSVDGLDTLNVVSLPHAPAERAGNRVREYKSSQPPIYGPISSATELAGYSPFAIRMAYDFPIEHNSTGGKPYDGSGRKSGIVIWGDPLESDLNAYLKYFGIKRTGPKTTDVFVDGGTTSDAAGGGTEGTLDAETILGDAPGTALYIYIPPDGTLAHITDAYEKVVSDNLVDTINSSFGVVEGLAVSTVKAWSHIAEQGASKGITFHAASGDYGGLNTGIAPGDSPYFLTVGGTALTVGVAGNRAYEIAWDGSTGGISTVFPMPSWQSGVAVTNRGRNVPDIAFNADPNTGTAYYFSGSWNTTDNPLGGTSLSSPTFGAAITEIDQLLNGRTGLVAPELYAIFSNDGYGSASQPYFYDITQGCAYVLCAGSGYDLVTGIGSMDVWNIGNVL